MESTNGIKINSKTTNAVATGVMGNLPRGTRYQEIEKILGKPLRRTDGKVDVEWTVEWADGTIATIYNWKNGPSYKGGTAIEDITDWNIGGNSYKAHTRVINLLGLIERMEAEWEEEDAQLANYRMPGE